MSDDNVVKMPDALERCAQRIDNALDRQEAAVALGVKAADDWRAATLDLAIELCDAKSKLNNDNIAFGRWCKERFGDNRLNENARGALVRWGADPQGTRAMLAKEESQSVQHIDRRLSQATKTYQTPIATTPKRTVAAATIRAQKAVSGVYPTVAQAVKASGLSRIVIEPALAAVKTEDSIAPSEPRTTKADNAFIEATLKLRLQELEKTFEARVQAEYQNRVKLMFPDLQDVRNKAALNEKIYREQLNKLAIFTKAEYVDLLFCVRNEHVPQDRRDRATIALEAKKLRLVASD